MYPGKGGAMVRNRVRAEHEIVKRALEIFQNNTRLLAQEIPPVTEGGFEPDVVIAITAGSETWRFPAVVKTNIIPTSIGATIGRLTPVLPKGLLLTRYVPPTLAETLREKGVQFLDAAGNAYLNVPPLFVFIKGNRPTMAAGVVKTKRAFQSSGLQVLYALLLRPALVAAPYREIARVADVALGTVGWVLRDLKELGYLIDMGPQGRRLTRKAELLDRWVTAYPDQLRPKLMIGRFSVAPPNRQAESGKLELLGACWGGEPAAARMTGHLKPQVDTVYTWQDVNQLVLQNKLRKDPQGNIEILKAFWSEAMQEEQGCDLAPPLVVYADLLATADPRNIETAQIIYEQKIAGFVRED